MITEILQEGSILALALIVIRNIRKISEIEGKLRMMEERAIWLLKT